MEPNVVNVGRHQDLTTETGPAGVGGGECGGRWVDSGMVGGVVVISFQFTGTLHACVTDKGTLVIVRASCDIIWWRLIHSNVKDKEQKRV